MASQVKMMLSLFVEPGRSDEWVNQQLIEGGFDLEREVMSFTADTNDDEGTDAETGEWLMQEVISKIH